MQTTRFEGVAWRVSAAALTAALVAGCSSPGKYIWVDQYVDQDKTAQRARNVYVIAPGDVLSVKVWNQEAMSARARVREDGMISLPFVNDVEAAGQEPTALAKRVEVKLKDYIVNPVVTIAVEEQAQAEISVLGEVARPGVYKIDHESDLLKILASAGGLTQIAGRDRIFVLRYGEGATPREPLRIRFTYKNLTQAAGKAALFRLHAGDVVVVE
jgi:polysaccharide export outer membrane protein